MVVRSLKYKREWYLPCLWYHQLTDVSKCVYPWSLWLGRGELQIKRSCFRFLGSMVVTVTISCEVVGSAIKVVRTTISLFVILIIVESYSCVWIHGYFFLDSGTLCQRVGRSILDTRISLKNCVELWKRITHKVPIIQLWRRAEIVYGTWWYDIT